MCDRQYYDEDINQLCCPDQPICETCWRDSRAQRRQETDVALKEYVLHLQAQGVIPKFDKVKQVKAARPEVPEPIPLPPGTESVYELTLTSPDDDVYYLRQSLQKIVESRMFEVISFKACVELTQAGLPHIHAILYSKKKFLDATKIKTKFKHRAELAKVRNLNNYLIYIHKEDGNPIIQDYCQKKGIPQFWDGQEVLQEIVP